MTSKRHNIQHSKKRLKERYELEVCDIEVAQIANKIRRQNSQPLEKLTSSRTLHLVSFKGKDLFVIYSKSTKAVVTVLTPSKSLYERYKIPSCSAMKEKGRLHE